ncbi:glycosyltransferase family 10 domain-containing protein [Yoonia vestfoldensis]|uniref:glycosyltransferase family 10 domain-containing protein n=1 Tax=Yoonia vestfoldensis TaxID=245188 RepID=UPI0003749C24|nr:glycosyltransferase family 10 [Yoonia vestfoldensis]
MKTIKLHYTDMWGTFDPLAPSQIDRILRKHFHVVLTDQDPDYVICSVFGDGATRRRGVRLREHHLYPDAIKIMYSGENTLPDLNFCDYGIGFDHLVLGDRYQRVPLFAMNDGYQALLQPRAPLTRDDITSSVEFCNFTFTNNMAMPARDQFFHLLNDRKPVLSTGRHLRNSDALDLHQQQTGLDPQQAKTDFLARFKFTIAFENSSHPGYTTEKVMDPLVARSVPIYLGNPRIADDFNTAAFINGHDFPSLDALADEVMRIDADDAAYLAILNAPPLPPGQREEPHLCALERFLLQIFTPPKAEAQRRQRYGWIGRIDDEYSAYRRRRTRRWRWF